MTILSLELSTRNSSNPQPSCYRAQRFVDEKDKIAKNKMTHETSLQRINSSPFILLLSYFDLIFGFFRQDVNQHIRDALTYISTLTCILLDCVKTCIFLTAQR